MNHLQATEVKVTNRPNVPQEAADEVPDDGGIGEMLQRRHGEQRHLRALGEDDSDAAVNTALRLARQGFRNRDEDALRAWP
jgi:hypothetical protein